MQNQGVWEVFSSGKIERSYFLALHTLLQVCHLVGAVLGECTAIIAWSGAWKCSGEEKMDVMQNQGVWEVSSSGKSERTYFLAQHTLLQVCYPVDAVVVKVTTIIAWSGK